jgi:hypothetical protein
VTPPAATAAGRALPRTATPRRAPRRVSGPAPRARRAPNARAQPRRRAPGAPEPLAVRALRRGRLLADSRLLDRLVRGRLWIPLVAAGLMGIVFMQVSMLKLNAGIGRAVQSASTLERQNATLRTDVSRMESGERIDAVAHGLGMVVPQDGGEHYVTAGARDLAARAAQRMTSPDPNTLARARAATAAATGTATTATSASAVAVAGAAVTTTPTVPPAAAQQAAAPPAATTAAASTAAASTAAASTAAASTAAASTAAAATPPATQTSSTGAAAAPAATQQTAAPAAPSAASAGGAAAPTDGTA